jgi:hypothetical protein
LFWSFFDLLREAMDGDDLPQGISFELEAIMTVLGRPFEALDNLGAYFRQALNLGIPLKKDVQAALRTLAGMGLIENVASKYKPGPFLRGQVIEFSDVGAHLTLKTSVRSLNGGLVTMHNFIFQGKSGNGLLWFNNNGTINLLVLSPTQIINLVTKVIYEPFHFFENNSEKSTAPAGRRRPPPERLS